MKKSTNTTLPGISVDHLAPSVPRAYKRLLNRYMGYLQQIAISHSDFEPLDKHRADYGKDWEDFILDAFLELSGFAETTLAELFGDDYKTTKRAIAEQIFDHSKNHYKCPLPIKKGKWIVYQPFRRNDAPDFLIFEDGWMFVLEAKTAKYGNADYGARGPFNGHIIILLKTSKMEVLVGMGTDVFSPMKTHAAAIKRVKKKLLNVLHQEMKREGIPLIGESWGKMTKVTPTLKVGLRHGWA